MQYTTNYSLKKPQYADEADIDVINDNTDDVDTLIHQNRTMIAPAFDNTKAYVTGDPVEYLGALYVFVADKAAGAWDASKVEPTTAAEMGGGGARALADLDDVEITNPAQGQALLFDDSDDKWKNQDLPDASVTKEATGNPIEITDAAAAPMVKCVTEITGSQDLHGYDKPWVGGAGVNQCDPNAPYETFDLTGGGVYRYGLSFAGGNTYTIVNNSTSSGIYYRTPKADLSDRGTSVQVDIGAYKTVNVPADCILWVFSGLVSDWQISSPNIAVNKGTVTTYSPYSNICPITAYTEGEIEVGGRNLCNQADKTTSGAGYVIGTKAPDYINTDHTVFPIGTYTFSFNVVGATSGSQAQVIFYVNDTKSAGNKVQSVTTDGRKSFTITASKPFAKIQMYYNGSSGGQFSKFQLERGEESHDYEPYINEQYTTTYPSAIYRGSEDVVNGEVTSEWITADPTTNGTMSYNGTSSYSVHYTWRASTPKKNGKNNFISNAFGVIESGDEENKIVGRDNSEIIEFLLPLSIGNNLTAAKAYIASYGTVVAYELATPTTSSVTPTNLPIRSLSGYNHIESSTGDMEIEYITKGEQAIVDLIEKSDHIYSTQEQAVGTWIDGKTLYEKTIVKQNISSVSTSTVLIPSSELTGMDIVEIGGSYISTTTASTYPINAYINSNSMITTWLAEGDIYYWLYWGAADTYDAYITIRYTKSSSNRSLSAPVTSQKSISEPLTDKTEEVPTEEEKIVEKPVEEETEEENETER